MKKRETHIIFNKIKYFIITGILLFSGIFMYAQEDDIVRFSHSYHPPDEVECTNCHVNIAESAKETDDNLPVKHKVCIECHENDELSPVVFYRPRPKHKLFFNHQVHIEQEIACDDCHKDISSEEYVSGQGFPKMAVCYECHDGETAPKTCSLCHAEKVNFPHITHKGEAECADCHENASESTVSIDNNIPVNKEICLDCHAQDVPSIVKFYDSKPKNTIEFNHQHHISEEGLECKFCHKAVHDEEFVAGGAFPAMKLCYECHDDNTAPKTCSLCHKSKVQFPHLRHKDEAECVDCHDNITESETTQFAPDIPKQSVCEDCHENAADYVAVVKMDYYKRTVEFNHKQHVGKQLMSCDNCHRAAYEKNEFENKEIVPEMEYCFQCHDNKGASQFCVTCHLEPLKPEDHYQGWTKQHKLKANHNQNKCLACHETEQTCLDCHKGSIKPKFDHNPNWELTHKYESRAVIKDCRSCHSERYCNECHTQKGVSLQSESRIKKVHPEGWMNDTDSKFHGRMAKFRLSSCKACHMPTDCNFCHVTGRK
ncbi:MAG: cytochrome c3 family protein [Spirochaetia bacterium]|nr:cytochrome c3 family protein [Spirochaetia bacterium]